jgi:hypothetical protein
MIAADGRRDALIAWSHAWPYAGWLAPVAVGLLGAATARILVVRFETVTKLYARKQLIAVQLPSCRALPRRGRKALWFSHTSCLTGSGGSTENGQVCRQDDQASPRLANR